MLDEIASIKCLINIMKKLELSWINQAVIFLYLVIIIKRLITIIMFGNIAPMC